MEPVRDYELRSFFTYVIQVIERLDIAYMVVGGFAAIMYGEPRLTIDVDIVVDIKPEHMARFVAAFPRDSYYVDDETVRDALLRRTLFNVIESSTAAKIDLIPLPDDAFTRAAMSRRQSHVYDSEGHAATFLSAEDVVLAKLSVHLQTGSEKHLRDDRGVLAMQWGILDLERLRADAQALDVAVILEELIDNAKSSLKGEA